MDVNAGAAVPHFRHHAWKVGDLQQVEFMRQALDGDRFHSWVAQQDFFIAACRRIVL